ncbi:MAG: hypothetical protein NT144_03690 [Bacteroidia bacterium]|nr:hypothetical protein [Bacteroidia bacterium]
MLTIGAYGQQFEESVSTTENADKPKVQVGADFAMQFQALEHNADTARLIPLGKGINLPTANLNINAILADGIEVNVTTYLSARHHNEAWVKGGYLLLDKLPFIHSALIDKAMEFLTFKVGVMEINYGDAHFRRSDNGNTIRNPFVGNYITDAFTTAPAFEALYRNNGIILMGAVTSGSLRPSLVTYSAASLKYTPNNTVEALAYYGKVGYDKQITEDFRLRATVSGYHASKNPFGSLYNGDRTGSRFYLVMMRATNSANDVDATANAFTGNWGPGLTNKDNSLMTNLFIKYKGLEFFGTYETLKGTTLSGAAFTFSQYAVEGLYRFGKEEQFLGGVRYNRTKNQTTSSVNRLEISTGWSLTPNILLKAEYVDQNYSNFDVYGGNAGFNGMMVESTISF